MRNCELRAGAQQEAKVLISCESVPFMQALNKKNIALAPWCGRGDCEESIKERSAAQAEKVHSWIVY
jgi:hypothetical protein